MICIFNLCIGQSRCSRRFGKPDHTPLHLQSRKWRWNPFGLQTVGVRWNFHWYLSFNLWDDDSKSMISKITCVEVWWVFFCQIIHISCNLPDSENNTLSYGGGIPVSRNPFHPLGKQLPRDHPRPGRWSSEASRALRSAPRHRSPAESHPANPWRIARWTGEAWWTICKIWLEYIDPKIST